MGVLDPRGLAVFALVVAPWYLVILKPSSTSNKGARPRAKETLASTASSVRAMKAVEDRAPFWT